MVDETSGTAWKAATGSKPDMADPSRRNESKAGTMPGGPSTQARAGRARWTAVGLSLQAMWRAVGVVRGFCKWT